MTVPRSILALLALASLMVTATAPVCGAEETPRSVYVWGEVMSPGAFPWERGMTVARAIEMAGGFAEGANRSRAKLIRGEREIILSAEDLSGTSGDGFRLEPGDIIRIERGAIRVEGEVRNPGDYGMEHGTVRQALVAAGGPTPMADLDAVYIARGGRVIRVDARKLLAGSAGVENPRLEPGDVLHVPKAQARVTIAGAVNRPGAYNLEPGKLERLEDLIAAAGGPTSNARLTRVELRRAPRPNERAQVEIINLQNTRLDELQRNPVLQSGDYVLVPGRRGGGGLSINEIYQIGILVLTLWTVVFRR